MDSSEKKICSPDNRYCLYWKEEKVRMENRAFHRLFFYSSKDTSQYLVLDKLSSETFFFIKWGEQIAFACNCPYKITEKNTKITFLKDKEKVPYVGSSHGFNIYSIEDFE